MLRTLIERAGFKQAFEESQAGGAGSKADELAAVPAALSHMHLDTLFERPVQAKLVDILLLPQTDRGFTSCVLVHGMGGTGKVSGLTIILSFVQIGSDCALLGPDGDGGSSNPRLGSTRAFLLDLLAGGRRGRGGSENRSIAGDTVQAAHRQGGEGRRE